MEILLRILFILALRAIGLVDSNLLLERYSYRIDFPWWSLGLAGGISLAFALAIVSSQALKAAMSNPVDSLRSE